MQTANILIDPLPLAIQVSGRDLPIETDFRTGILFEQLVESNEVPQEEKIAYAVNLYFPGRFPSNALEQIQAVEGMLWFYSCGDGEQPKQQDQQQNSAGIARRIYDYDIDAPLIYSAFLAQYNIDLQDIQYLHWWKFIAMFRGLAQHHKIVEIMGYRAMNIAKIKNRAEREHYAALQAKYALPDNRSAEEKAAAAGALFGGMF